MTLYAYSFDHNPKEKDVKDQKQEYISMKLMDCCVCCMARHHTDEIAHAMQFIIVLMDNIHLIVVECNCCWCHSINCGLCQLLVINIVHFVYH